jgi:hypothetical protein
MHFLQALIRYGTLLLALTVILQTFTMPLVYLDFKIRQDYIATSKKNSSKPKIEVRKTKPSKNMVSNGYRLL